MVHPQSWAAHISLSGESTASSSDDSTPRCENSLYYLAFPVPRPRRRRRVVPSSSSSSASSSDSSDSPAEIRARRRRPLITVSSDDSSPNPSVSKRRQSDVTQSAPAPPPTDVALAFWGGGPTEDALGRSLGPTLTAPLDEEEPPEEFKRFMSKIEQKLPAEMNPAARIASKLFLQPLSSQFLRSLIPAELAEYDEIWSEKNSEMVLSDGELLLLALRRSSGERLETLLHIARREMLKLREILDSDERSVDISEVSLAHLGLLAFYEGFEEALAMAEAFAAFSSIGTNQEVVEPYFFRPDGIDLAGLCSIRCAMRLNWEVVRYFRPGAPCFLCNARAVVYKLCPGSVSDEVDVHFLTEASSDELLTGSARVSWDPEWAHLSICASIAKTHLASELSRLCLENKFASESSVLPKAAHFVVAHVPLAIGWSLLPLRLSLEGGATVAKRHKDYRDCVKQLLPAVQASPEPPRLRPHPSFFGGCAANPHAAKAQPRGKGPSGYLAQNLNHIIAKFLMEKNADQVAAVQKVLTACGLNETGSDEAGRPAKSSRLTFIRTTEPAALCILSAAAVNLLSTRMKRVFVQCETLPDYFEVLAQLYGFCENAFGEPFSHQTYETNKKYARWLRSVSFGSFVLTGTKHDWSQELRAQWPREKALGPDEHILPFMSQWWDARSFADTLHGHFRRDVCFKSIKALSQLIFDPPSQVELNYELPHMSRTRGESIDDEHTRRAAICWLLFLLRRFGPYYSGQEESEAHSPPASSLHTTFRQVVELGAALDPVAGPTDPSYSETLRRLMPLVSLLASESAESIHQLILANARVVITGPLTTSEELSDSATLEADVIMAVSSSPRGFSKGDVLNITAFHLELKSLLLFGQTLAGEITEKLHPHYTHAQLEAMRCKGLIQYHQYKDSLGLSWPTQLENLGT